MNAKNIFFLILLLNVNILFAQDFKFGTILGLATTQVSGDNLGGYFKGGLVAGLFTQKKAKEHWYFQIEFTYNGKGSRYSNFAAFTDSTRNANPGFNPYYFMRLRYLQFPFLFQYKNKKFLYEFGSSLGALLDAQIFDANGPLNPNVPGGIEQDPFNRLEWSWLIGLTYSITPRLFINWRISKSIAPIRSYALNIVRFNLFNKIGQYNDGLEFTLRYYFTNPEVFKPKEIQED